LYEYKISQISNLKEKITRISRQYDKILAIIPLHLHDRFHLYLEKTINHESVHDQELETILQSPLIKHYGEAITPTQKAIDLLRQIDSQLHQKIVSYQQQVTILRSDDTELQNDYCTTTLYFCEFIKNEKNRTLLDAIQNICYNIKEYDFL
jgi:hypothetical protein